MKQRHPLPIHHSWPLYERERHFALGQLLDYQSLDADVVIGSRGAKPLTRYFPELVQAFATLLPEPCLLDGEIVVGLKCEVGYVHTGIEKNIE